MRYSNTQVFLPNMFSWGDPPFRHKCLTKKKVISLVYLMNLEHSHFRDVRWTQIEWSILTAWSENTSQNGVSNNRSIAMQVQSAICCPLWVASNSPSKTNLLMVLHTNIYSLCLIYDTFDVFYNCTTKSIYKLLDDTWVVEISRNQI